jgi:phosphate acyltransferase
MSGRMIRIAVDAMGGDHFPDIHIRGSLEAVRNYPDVEVKLVGDEKIIRGCLNRIIDSNDRKKDPSTPYKELLNRIQIVHAEEVIDMSESPGRAVRAKKNSSIVLCNKLCHSGEVDAVIAAGNTGAAMAASLLYMGRLPGVSRPAIMGMIPSEKSTVAILDMGANTDCKPVHLYQFAVMGSLFTRHVFGYQNPRVGLLNIGEERSKGNELTCETYTLLENSSLNFIGNVEGRDIFKGMADVVVCDGFVGNVLLKFAESIFSFITYQLRQKSNNSAGRKVLALMIKPMFKEIKKDMSPEDYGGAPLMGVDGICIICHGNSSPVAITNAIKVARKLVFEEVNVLIKNELTRNSNLANE